MSVARALIATSLAAATIAVVVVVEPASAAGLESIDLSSGNPGFSLLLAGVAVALYLARRWRG